MDNDVGRLKMRTISIPNDEWQRLAFSARKDGQSIPDHLLVLIEEAQNARFAKRQAETDALLARFSSAQTAARPPAPVRPFPISTHPVIVALVEELPPPKTVWPADDKDDWINAIRGLFRIIYPEQAAGAQPLAHPDRSKMNDH